MSPPTQLSDSESAIIPLIMTFAHIPNAYEPAKICTAAAIWALMRLQSQGSPNRTADRAELLSALVYAVSTPHCPSKIEKWNELASFCSCDMNDRWLAAIPVHCPKRESSSTDARWNKSTRPLGLFILTVFEFLDPVIRDVEPTQFTEKGLKKQKWPRKVEDLVPTSLQYTASAMSQWLQYTKSTHPLNFLVTLFPIIPPTVDVALRHLPFFLPVVLTFRLFARNFPTISSGDVPASSMLTQAWHYGQFFTSVLQYRDFPIVGKIFPTNVAKDMFEDCGLIYDTLLAAPRSEFCTEKLPLALYAQARDAFAQMMEEQDRLVDMRPLMDVDVPVQS